MLSDNSLRQISSIFCGDIEGYYTYKTGPKLVSFFNQYFRSHDQYGQGFPSRWAYVYNKLYDMLSQHRFDFFLDVVLNRDYLMQDLRITPVEAAEKANMILAEFNRIISQDRCIITRTKGIHHLVSEDEDLILIGSGGFANVYRQKSTGLIVKKLKDDFLADKGIRSRFKREYNITKSLQDAHGIITVYSFDEGNCSYTMEPAEMTLEKYIQNNTLPEETKVNCIRQVLFVMTEVHKRDIIHRDISANNIFVINGTLKIADFGLGKDLNVFNSHNTFLTSGIGQYIYCAPEQFMMLKEGDKRSDVYSLGRVINFIMTGDPRNTHHVFRNVAEKATNENAAYRYADARQLSVFFEKSITFRMQSANQTFIDEKIHRKVFDETIESYFYELNAEKLSSTLLSKKAGFSDALLSFMHLDDAHALYIVLALPPRV